jgi:hypothetical protein
MKTSDLTGPEPTARKHWEEPCIALERSLQVSAQGGPPSGAPPGGPGPQFGFMGPLTGSGQTGTCI